MRRSPVSPGPLWLAIAAATTLLWLPQTHANEVAITKAQQAQLQQVMKSADARVEAGFKGQEKLKDEMLIQLKVIGAMKNPSDRIKAGGTYQAKYRKSYAAVLARGGLDLQKIAQQLRPILPGVIFRVSDDLTIVGTLIDSSSTGPLPAPGPTTREVRNSEFEVSKTKSCGLAAGGDVTSTTTSLKSTALAAVAGGCANGGTKTASLELPAERKAATVRAEGDLHAEAFAIAIVGTAISSAGASFGVICEGDFDGASLSVLALAPLAWIASEEEDLERASRQVNVPSSIADCTVRADSNASAIAAIGETHSSGEVKRFAASVTIEQ